MTYQVVQPKICEMCERPFYRAAAECRALAEKDCPACSAIESQRQILQAQQRRIDAAIARQTRVPYWSHRRLAERALNF